MQVIKDAKLSDLTIPEPKNPLPPFDHSLSLLHFSDYASWLNAESITFDGGEFRSLAGEFNQLKKVPEEMWDAMEQMIRSSNKKSKV